MKRLFLILVCLPIFTEAQVYKAGTVYPYYYDINPDTLLNITGNNSPVENYFFDVNNDLINDYRMQAFGLGGLGGGTHYINFTALNSNSYIRFGRIDSTWHSYFTYWMLTSMAKPLTFGDSINSKLSVWSNASLYLTDNSGSAGSYTYPNDWISANDLFIGLKHQTSSDTLFGWIRVNCPNAYRCYVKDFSVSKCVNFPVLNPVSTPSIVCISESATLSAQGANSYSWSTGSTINSIVITPTVTTNYTVSGVDLYGCTTNSVISVIVNSCIGINEHKQADTLSIYPNPANDKVEFVLNTTPLEIKIKLLNCHGQIVMEESKRGSNRFELDIINCNSGLYFIEVEFEHRIIRAKFVKD